MSDYDFEEERHIGIKGVSDVTASLVLDMFEKGADLEQIVEETKLTYKQLVTLLKKHGYVLEPRKRESAIDRLGPRLQEFLDEYYAFVPNYVLAEKYELNASQIPIVIRELGKTVRSRTAEHIQAKRWRLDEAIRLYTQTDMPRWEICQTTGVDSVALHMEMKKRGLKTRRQLGKPVESYAWFSPEQVAEAIRLYTETDTPLTEICETIGCANVTLYKWLSERNLPTRSARGFIKAK